MDYKSASWALIRRQQRAAIAWIITLQTKYFFHGETIQLAEFFLMNNNICAHNPLIYHSEVPITLYGEDSLPTAGQKRKFYREDKPTEYRRDNKNDKPKVDIHDLLKKHFTNCIWKVNPYIQLGDTASFCNINTSALSKEENIRTLGMLQRFSSPYCKNIHRK